MAIAIQPNSELPMTLTPTALTQIAAHPDDRHAIGFAPLSLDEVYQLADNPANGAVVIMSGTVRDRTDGQAVEYLEYQAYEPMAMRVFAQIGLEIRQKWTDVTRVVIHHRVGKLKIGEISVLVAVGCPHRAEAFAACQYAIDALKHQAPIWKKEHWASGASSWVNIGDCDKL
jgi:molybdopterin synthase catalytic subunit